MEGKRVVLGPTWGRLLAIAVGRERIRCAITRADGRLTEYSSHSDQPVVPVAGKPLSPTDFTRALTDLITECMPPPDEPPIVACGISWPGRIRVERKKEKRKIVESETVDRYEQQSNGWEKKPDLRGLVSNAIEAAGLDPAIGVHIVNDADAQLLAHLDTCGEGEEEENICQLLAESRVVMGVTIAGGVGASLGVRGRLCRGGHGFAGELGHVPVDIDNIVEQSVGGVASLKTLVEDSAFKHCQCGHAWCLDRFASGRRIIDQLDKILNAGPSYNARAEQIETKLEDPAVRRVMHRAGELIGQALIGPMLVLDPEVVLVSSFSQSGELLRGIEESVNSSAGHLGLDTGNIVLAPRNDWRMAQGAARHAFERHIRPFFPMVIGARSKQELARLAKEFGP